MSEPAPAPADRRTVLYDNHKALGARFISFGGWDMPVMYSTIQDEHTATRTQAGLFDLCHMGRLMVRGTQHKELIHKAWTNNVLDLEPGRARYGIVCNDDGGALDDILVYADTQESFVVVNASNRERIVGHLRTLAEEFDATVDDLSDDLAMIAIQGPESVAIVDAVSDLDIDAIPYYGHATGTVAGAAARVARTGYTGEDGFEFYVSATEAPAFWDALLEAGRDRGLKPVGLAARDTLRLEASMPLYGHEINESISPLEAGLNFAIKLKKDPPFVGQEALKRQKAEGLTRKLVGLELKDKRVPREGYEIVHDGDVVGQVVSGTASPSLDKNIAQGYVPVALAKAGTDLHIRIRGKDLPAVVIPRPFYKRAT